MFGLGGSSLSGVQTVYYLKENAVILMIGLIFCFPVMKWFEKMCEGKKFGKWLEVVKTVIYPILLIVAFAFVFTSTVQSFIYFQF